MKLGIMQPYIFPYIGYFQLISAVDKFVIYDDVAFIKQGWINRNNILVNGKAHLFTVPLKNASSFSLIRETEINKQLFDQWKPKFLKTLAQAYCKAPFFSDVSALIGGVLNTEVETISGLAALSLTETCRYLGIRTEFLFSAATYGNNSLKAADRVIDICKRENATEYINPIGGMELYSKADFEHAGIKLYFVKTHGIRYAQAGEGFVPWLSIIDVMMFNPKEKINGLLSEFDKV